MPISSFSPKTDAYFTSTKTMMGAYIDKKYVDRFTLYSLTCDISKASIIQKLIIDFVEKEIPSMNVLMEEVIEIGIRDWEDFKKSNRTTPDKKETHKNIYINEFRRGLKSKRIPQLLMENLITAVEEKMI